MQSCEKCRIFRPDSQTYCDCGELNAVRCGVDADPLAYLNAELAARKENCAAERNRVRRRPKRYAPWTLCFLGLALVVTAVPMAEVWIQWGFFPSGLDAELTPMIDSLLAGAVCMVVGGGWLVLAQLHSWRISAKRQ